MANTKSHRAARLAMYILGISMMALGTTLSTKTGLGVSCITSTPAAISKVIGWNLSVIVFILYLFMIAAQFLIKKKEQRTWCDLLQLPVSIAFTSFLEWFGTLFDIHFTHLWENLLLMAVAVVVTGIGVCFTVNMEIAPNPPDGLVYVISEATHKDMGLIKNILDMSSVAIAATVDFLSAGKITTIGIGTVCAMIFIGRTIYVVNRFFKKKMRTLAGFAS